MTINAMITEPDTNDSWPFSPSSISKLQTIQNSALRIATGSLQMASASHQHSEAEVLPHLSLLCSQYLASALRPHHPSHPIVT
jgi:hypothetical protein